MTNTTVTKPKTPPSIFFIISFGVVVVLVILLNLFIAASGPFAIAISEDPMAIESIRIAGVFLIGMGVGMIGTELFWRFVARTSKEEP